MGLFDGLPRRPLRRARRRFLQLTEGSGFGPLVSPEWLAEHHRDADVRVIDLRWYLDGRSGREAYEKGHVPGAVFVDLERDITASSGPGRHPLPAREQFTEAMQRAGVGTQTRVVAYDDAGGSIAARLWWLLRFFGHSRAAVLDGGLQAWPGELETSATGVERGDFQALEPEAAAVVDLHWMRHPDPAAVVLDARAPERYRGDNEPVDPRAGHIPGAVNAYWAHNLDEHGRFLSAEQLRRRYAELGVATGDEVVAYCGSGVTSCHDLVALEVAGFRGARLYPGSWSEWSARDDTPLATGDG